LVSRTPTWLGRTDGCKNKEWLEAAFSEYTQARAARRSAGRQTASRVSLRI
jgi:hypothetical protein